MGPQQLSPRQEEFCRAYLEIGNASEAYRRVYPGSRTWLAQTLHNRASSMLRVSLVAARIAELRARSAEYACVSEARVLEEAARVGLFDPARMFGPDGSLLPISEMPAEVRAAIASFEVEEVTGDGAVVVRRLKKIKLWDKNSALEKLFKHLGLFERDNKQRSGAFDGLPRERVQAIEQRLRELVAGADQQIH